MDQVKNGDTGSHEQNVNQSDFSKFQWIQFSQSSSIDPVPESCSDSKERTSPRGEFEQLGRAPCRNGWYGKNFCTRIVDIFYRRYTMLISIDTPTICASREAFYYKHVSIQLPNHSVFAIISSEWKYFPNRTKYHCQIALDRSENPEKCTGLVESDHAHA